MRVGDPEEDDKQEKCLIVYEATSGDKTYVFVAIETSPP